MPVIVILPFNNMSSDSDQTFLADGIVEDVTTELSRFCTLSVIARNSAFAYKGTHRDIRKIAHELGAQYVVEGPVRRGGDRLRVTAQLIEAETGTTGRGQDTRNALDTAEGLNPNNAALNFARALWCQFQPEPDSDAVEAAAGKALLLSPKDPMAAAFHAAIGSASILRHFGVGDETYGKAYETASRYPNADFWMFVATAVHHAGCGRTDEAAHYLQQALARNPLLTLAGWHSMFAMPVWPRLIAASEGALERLVALGLPRE